MNIDLDRVNHLAQNYGACEFFAALIAQRQFNEFDGQKVLDALIEYQDNIESFIFWRPIYWNDKRGLSYSQLVQLLTSMEAQGYNFANQGQKITYFAADTLSLLVKSEPSIIEGFRELGKQIKATELWVIDGKDYDHNSASEQAELKTSQVFLQPNVNFNQVTMAVIEYWWD